MADKPDEATDPGATVENESIEPTDPLADTDRRPIDTRSMVPTDGTLPDIPQGVDPRTLVPADGTQPDIPQDVDTRSMVPADGTLPDIPLHPAVPATDPDIRDDETAESPSLAQETTDPQPGESGAMTAKGVGSDWSGPTNDADELGPEFTNPNVDPWPAPLMKKADAEPDSDWAELAEEKGTEPHVGDAGSITAKGVGEWAPATGGDSDTAQAPTVIAEKAQPASVERTVRLDLAQQDELMRLRAQQDEVMRERFEQDVVVMFTDVAGSTAYYEKYGDLAGRQKMLTHNALLFPIIRAQNGTVVKTAGDSIMACFETTNQALAAAAEMQHTLAEFNTSAANDDEAIHIRVGLNAGKAIPEHGDLHGDVVNVAARIEESAQAGEILLADVVARQAESWPLVLVGPVALKGKRDPLVLHRLKWKEETTGRGTTLGPVLPDHMRPRFQLQGTVDRGPLGIVYLARDVKRDAPVAIKLLYSFVTQSAEARRYFRDQMWSNAQLQHPGISRVLEFAASRDDRAYVVSEYIDGINLTQHVAQSGRPSMHELARIGYHLAAALEHAHEHGCIHGDVKPENVLLTTDGRVKLTDFGLVGLWTDKPTGDPMTSPAFMAPQALAGPATDPTIDVYSLGALLYFLAVGHGPLEGTDDATAVTMRAVFSGRIRPLSHVNPDLPSELIAIVDKAMSPSTSKRFQSMAALKMRLAAFLESLGPEQEPPARPAPDAGRTRLSSPAIKEDTQRTNLAAMAEQQRLRRPLWIALGVVALIPLVIAVVLILTR